MCLSYAILCFLAGLASVVISPLASRLVWDNDAKVWPLIPVKLGRYLNVLLTLLKTVTVFLMAGVLASSSFVVASFGAHHLTRQ